MDPAGFYLAPIAGGYLFGSTTLLDYAQTVSGCSARKVGTGLWSIIMPRVLAKGTYVVHHGIASAPGAGGITMVSANDPTDTLSLFTQTPVGTNSNGVDAWFSIWAMPKDT